MESVLSCWGGAQVLPLVTRVARGTGRGAPWSGSLEPAGGVVPQDPAGLLVLGVRRGRAGCRGRVVAARLGLRLGGAEHHGARGVGGAAQRAPLQWGGELP